MLPAGRAFLQPPGVQQVLISCPSGAARLAVSCNAVHWSRCTFISTNWSSTPAMQTMQQRGRNSSAGRSTTVWWCDSSEAAAAVQTHCARETAVAPGSCCYLQNSSASTRGLSSCCSMERRCARCRAAAHASSHSASRGSQNAAGQQQYSSTLHISRRQISSDRLAAAAGCLWGKV